MCEVGHSTDSKMTRWLHFCAFLYPSIQNSFKSSAKVLPSDAEYGKAAAGLGKESCQ